MKFLRMIKILIAVDLAKQMIYQWNFIIKIFAMLLGDVIGPLIALLIYTSSSGIPGWDLYEFILFQGVLLIAFGVAEICVTEFPGEVMEAVREGEFDKYLIKPYYSLLLVMANGFDMKGLAELIFGSAVTIWALAHLGITPTLAHIALFILFIIAAFLVQWGGMILIAAISFFIVRSDALFHLYYKLFDFARYPLTLYGLPIKFVMIFLFPVAVASYYPVEALLHGLSMMDVFTALVPVAVFFSFSIWLWHYGVKNYTSAGG